MSDFNVKIFLPKYCVYYELISRESKIKESSANKGSLKINDKTDVF
jgi:hypothetical protein